MVWEMCGVTCEADLGDWRRAISRSVSILIFNGGEKGFQIKIRLISFICTD